MNPLSQEVFSMPAPCLPCCTPPGPTVCSCALQTPAGGSPYLSYAAAVTGIADRIASCLTYYDPNGTTGNSLTASFDGSDLLTTFTTDGVDQGGGIFLYDVKWWASLGLKAGSTLSIGFAMGAMLDGAIRAELYRCDNLATPIDDDSSVSTSGTLTLNPPSDGEYYVKVFIANISSPVTYSTSLDITCDDIFWVNPAIAQWDDSGPIRSLWACPKLLLPIGTESSGNWYVDCAAAAAVLADSLQVSNCVGFCQGGAGLASFTATDGGPSLTLAQTLSPAQANGATMNGGINAVAGQTLSFAFTTNATTPSYLVAIFDDAGNVVEFIGPSGSSPLISSPLPYTGRYTVALIAGDAHVPAAMTSVSIVVTSSGALSVNPIQARYDAGLACPGTLDCGDTCP